MPRVILCSSAGGYPAQEQKKEESVSDCCCVLLEQSRNPDPPARSSSTQKKFHSIRTSGVAIAPAAGDTHTRKHAHPHTRIRTSNKPNVWLAVVYSRSPRPPNPIQTRLRANPADPSVCHAAPAPSRPTRTGPMPRAPWHTCSKPTTRPTPDDTGSRTRPRARPVHRQTPSRAAPFTGRRRRMRRRGRPARRA